MIIKYSNKLDTSMKYDDLKIHFYIIDNVLLMKIESQDDKLRINDDLITVHYNTTDSFKPHYFYISSASSPEISKTMLYIGGIDSKYDDILCCYDFYSYEEVMNYINDIIKIFDNINIFHTYITISNVNLETNIVGIVSRQTYGGRIS